MLKKIVITSVILVIIAATSLYGGKQWLISLLPDKAHFLALQKTQPDELPYLTNRLPANRGKILAVVTSVDSFGENRTTGYEHTELARAYWVFVANGFEVDIASPNGGKPPVKLDGDDMGAFDYAFLNDGDIQHKVAHSIPLADVDPLDYEAVYYVGGKGTMFDFPFNQDIKRITKTLYQNDKVISAVCHGPAALVNVQLDNGEMLLSNKKVSGFTNEEELLIIPDAAEIFPFLLQDKLIAQGAQFQAGPAYLNQVSQDGKIITGQNPWSVWSMAEMVVRELGYEPVPRKKTPEEYSVGLLQTYQKFGLEAAKTQLHQHPDSYQQLLIVMHGVLAFMQFEIGKGIEIIGLAVELKELISEKSGAKR
ncbi:MAG: type 1 glutamine amidotransferase domain-containing protein [Aestuariibacter sp.]